MKIKHIIALLHQWASPTYQESYDNATLITGDSSWCVTSILVTLDCTENVVDEAITKGANLIIAHHPIVFKGLKSITGKTYVERTVIKAIKSEIAIFSVHTNLDHVSTGVNKMISEKIGLKDCHILSPKKGLLSKITTFIPNSDAQKVIDKLHEVGVGEIGNYDYSSFQVMGKGVFRPNAQASPAIGTCGHREEVEEIRIEAIFPSYLHRRVVEELKASHPYEEVAYFVSALENDHPTVGAGMIGQLSQPMNAMQFLTRLKSIFNLSCVRYTDLCKLEVQRVAVCGGAGSFLLPQAISKEADVFVTADFKYHEFFDADKQVVIVDIGHYESEVFTKELICNYLKEKVPSIVLNISEVDTNPINYY